MNDTQREFERLHHLAHPNFNNYEKLPSGKYANKFVQDDWIYFQWVWQAALAHSQWISVEDMLPNVDTPVLMRVSCSDYFNIEEGQWRNGYWVNCWAHRRSNSDYPVTHWMPLPQPPITNRKDE